MYLADCMGACTSCAKGPVVSATRVHLADLMGPPPTQENPPVCGTRMFRASNLGNPFLEPSSAEREGERGPLAGMGMDRGPSARMLWTAWTLLEGMDEL